MKNRRLRHLLGIEDLDGDEVVAHGVFETVVKVNDP